MNKAISYNTSEKSMKISLDNMDLNLLDDLNFNPDEFEDLKSVSDSNKVQIVHENLEELIKGHDGPLPIESSLLFASLQEESVKDEPKPKKKGSKPRKPKAYDSMMTKWRFKK